MPSDEAEMVSLTPRYIRDEFDEVENVTNTRVTPPSFLFVQFYYGPLH